MKVDCGTKATQQVSLRENAGDSLIFNECVNNPCHTCFYSCLNDTVTVELTGICISHSFMISRT